MIISRPRPTGERAFRLLPPYQQIDGLTKTQLDILKNDAISVANKKQPQSELTTLTGYQKEIKAQLAKIVAEVNSSTTPQPAPAISNIYVQGEESKHEETKKEGSRTQADSFLPPLTNNDSLTPLTHTPSDMHHYKHLTTPGYIDGSIPSACNSDVKKDSDNSVRYSLNNSAIPGSPHLHHPMHMEILKFKDDIKKQQQISKAVIL